MQKHDRLAVTHVDVADFSIENLHTAAWQMVRPFRLSCRDEGLPMRPLERAKRAWHKGAEREF